MIFKNGNEYRGLWQNDTFDGQGDFVDCGMRDQMTFMCSGTWSDSGKRFEGSMIITELVSDRRLIDIKSPVLYEQLTSWLGRYYTTHFPEYDVNVFQEGATPNQKDCFMLYDSGDVYIGPLTHGRRLIYKEGKIVYNNGDIYDG